jgi:hypothetical protein
MYNKLKDLIKYHRITRYEMGAILHRFKSDQLWEEEIGEGVGGFHDFVAMPEIGLTTREANVLIQDYEFIEELGLDAEALPTANLRHMVKTNRGITGEMVEAAMHLSPKDFKERYYDIAKPEGERTYTYMVMRRCIETGNLEKVHGVESEEVLQAFNDKIDGG